MKLSENIIQQLAASYKQKLGILILTVKRLCWLETLEQEHPTLSIPYTNINKLMRSKNPNATPKLQIQLLQPPTPDLATLTLGFANVKDRDCVQEELVQRLPGTRHSAPPAAHGTFSQSQENAWRIKVLQENEPLRRLHRTLVIQGRHLSENEFWQTRNHLIREQQLREWQKTRKGVSSDWINVKPQLEEGSAPRIRVEGEELEKIRFLYPSIDQAYKDNVAESSELTEGKLSKEEFWKRYFTAKLQQQANQEVKDGLFKSCFEKDTLCTPPLSTGHN